MNTNHCPLCGHNNDCALTTGKTIEQCWCLTTELNQQALNAIPSEDKGKRCICKQCANKARILSHPAKP